MTGLIIGHNFQAAVNAGAPFPDLWNSAVGITRDRRSPEWMEKKALFGEWPVMPHDTLHVRTSSFHHLLPPLNWYQRLNSFLPLRKEVGVLF
jgi:hypothetical protein